ncbi:glycosyltransferase, partial [Streptomyces cyaneofuscatus]
TGPSCYPVSALVNLVASGALLYGAVSGLGMDKNLAALAAGVIVTPVSFLLARWAIMSGRRRTEAAEVAGAAVTDRSEPRQPLTARPMADRTLAPRPGEKR